MTQITVPQAAAGVRGTATPGQTSFPFVFTFFSTSDVRFVLEGVEKINGTQFTVTPTLGYTDGYPGGTVNYPAGAPNGAFFAILRDQPETWESSSHFLPTGPFDPSRLNLFFMKVWARFQETTEKIEAAARLTRYDNAGPQNHLPYGKVARANLFVGFDAEGDFVAKAAATMEQMQSAIDAVMSEVADAHDAASDAQTSAAEAAMSAAASAASAAASANSALASANSAVAASAFADAAESSADAAAASAGVFVNAWHNAQVSKTAAYVVNSTDGGKTFVCTNGPWELTVPAVTGVPGEMSFAVVNAGVTRGIVVRFPSADAIGGNFWLFPGQNAIIYRAGLLWAVKRDERWRLTGTTVMYVDPTNGNSLNDGLAAGAGGAVASFSDALLRICSGWDFNQQQAKIQLADGNYAPGLVIDTSANWIGGGELRISGNVASPPLLNMEWVYVDGAKAGLVSVEGGHLKQAVALNGAKLNLIGALIFVAHPGNAHINAENGALIDIHNNYTVQGSASAHIRAAKGAALTYIGAPNVTVSGTPAFSYAFADGFGTGVIEAVAATFTGAATGARYNAFWNGFIHVGGRGPNVFPGDVAGAAGGGGQYI